jgi:hypothetical protein
MKKLAVGDKVTFKNHEYTVTHLSDAMTTLRRPVVYGGVAGMYDEELDIPTVDPRHNQINIKETKNNG